MRIIAGEHKGRRLQAPKGDGTRPTTDRVRESLMSVIVSARGGLEGACVLDAFAGSGALGLEALSRGAACATFCERDAKALQAVQANARACGYGTDKARIIKADLFTRGIPAPFTTSAYDVVFLDPPYALAPAEVFELVAKADAAGYLAQSSTIEDTPPTLITYEHATSSTDQLDAAFTQTLGLRGFALSSKRTYGDTALAIYTRG